MRKVIFHIIFIKSSGDIIHCSKLAVTSCGQTGAKFFYRFVLFQGEGYIAPQAQLGLFFRAHP